MIAEPTPTDLISSANFNRGEAISKFGQKFAGDRSIPRRIA